MNDDAEIFGWVDNHHSTIVHELFHALAVAVMSDGNCKVEEIAIGPATWAEFKGELNGYIAYDKKKLSDFGRLVVAVAGEIGAAWAEHRPINFHLDQNRGDWQNAVAIIEELYGEGVDVESTVVFQSAVAAAKAILNKHATVLTNLVFKLKRPPYRIDRWNSRHFVRNGGFVEKLQANKVGDTLTIYIYDEIGPTAQGFCGAEELIEQLNAYPNIGQINVRLNSPGGDVGESLAIYNALDRSTAYVTVYIDALAASGASIVACSGDEVVMSPYSLFMMHNAWSVVAGPANDLRKTASVLDTIDETMIVPVYKKRSGLTSQTIRSMMAAETWLSPGEAINKGFADKIGNDVGVTRIGRTGSV